MTRFTSILSTLALVPTTFALATPAVAGVSDEVKAHFGETVDPNAPHDLDCDGRISLRDYGIAGYVTQVHSSPDFNPFDAVNDNFDATIEELGPDFPFEADMNGDCVVGIADLALEEHALPAIGVAQTVDLLAILAADWGTESDSPADLDCDGVVGISDYQLIGQVVTASRAPHYDPMVAARQGFNSVPGDPNYHPAADDGDCVIGFSDYGKAQQAIAAEAEQ